VSDYSDIVDGLQTVLEAAIPGLHVYNHPVDGANEFPAAIILPEDLDMRIAFTGNTFEGSLRVVFLISAGGDTEDGFTQLYDYIDPTEANKSVTKAVRDDGNLNGKADSCDVTVIENIGRRAIWDGNYFGFDAVVEFVKTVD
jgi:hypothetical protein